MTSASCSKRVEMRLFDDDIMALRRHDVTTSPARYIRRDRENSLLSRGETLLFCRCRTGRTTRASHASGKPLHNGSPWFRGYLCRMRSFRSRLASRQLRDFVRDSVPPWVTAEFHEIARKTGLIGWRAITQSGIPGNDVFACAFVGPPLSLDIITWLTLFTPRNA